MEENSFGKRLRAYRLRVRQTQDDLAKAMGVDFTYVSKIENGRAPPPKRNRIERAAQFLGLSQEEEIDLLLLAQKLPSDVQDWALDQPRAVALYRSIKKAAPQHQEEILDELIERVRQRLSEEDDG